MDKLWENAHKELLTCMRNNDTLTLFYRDNELKLDVRSASKTPTGWLFILRDNTADITVHIDTDMTDMVTLTFYSKG